MSMIVIRNEEISDIEYDFEEKGFNTQLLDKPPSTKHSMANRPYIINGMVAAFMSLIWYTASNYVSGTQSGDVFAGKIANSLSLGLIGIIYTSVMLIKKDEQFVKAFQVLMSIWKSSRYHNDDHNHGEVIKALIVSFLCGLFNSFGMTSLYVAFYDAEINSLNISIWVAILSGNCLIALFASFAIFKDQITILQTLGVLVNMGGILLIFFEQGSGGATMVMVVGSAIASLWLGFRVMLSRYWTDRLDSLVFMNFNFFAELTFGIVWIIIAEIGWYDFEVDISAQAIMFFGGIFAAGAEIYLFMGIERGITGVVVSIAGWNTILVGLLNWILQGAQPSTWQMLAILWTFIGILTLSIGDIIVLRIKRCLHHH